MLSRRTLLASTLLLAQDRAKEVCITIDDLPFVGPRDLPLARETTVKILYALREHKAPATGFVNERQLQVAGERDARVGLLQQWLDAGMTLGNHTFSHPDYNRLTLEQYADEIIRGEVVTRPLMRDKGHLRFYFRHPYTHTGDTREKKAGLETFLKSRDYRVAPFTVETADYIFASLYRRMPERKVVDAYLDHNDVMFGYFEKLAQDLFGRPICHILLIHSNQLHAACLGELLDRLNRRGYRFINLDEALEDAAYQSGDGYIGTNGPSWLHRWCAGMGKPMDLRNEPDPPRWILDAQKSG
jgi:peptidoglycan/xylan/chitin deacetylase (PgdA/CDA1 family)